jgi:hypothetical protein
MPKVFTQLTMKGVRGIMKSVETTGEDMALTRTSSLSTKGACNQPIKRILQHRLSNLDVSP